MNFFLRELRRRNVARVAILYGVVGWLVLQIGDLLIPALGIPSWGLSLLVVLVVLGFPIALVLAWAYEVTPEGIKRTHEVEHHESITHLTGRKLDFLIIGVLAAALLYGVVDLFVLRERGILAPQPRASTTGASIVSIAVLPFVDMSQTKDQEYLTDGISEELLNVLARVEGFKVTGRTSAFAFKGRDEDLRAIGQKLGVENILEGSVRKQGDRIRVTAQLVKAADGYHLWSETYDRQLGDVFAIQDDIARQVVVSIRSTLGQSQVVKALPGAAEHRPTDNIEAYTHFLRGQHLLRTRERAGMEAALVQFERAGTLDPGFARARVGIANSLVLLASYGMRDLPTVEARAASELTRALSIEPDLPDALAGQALLAMNKAWGAANQSPLLERAVAGNPSDSQSLVWLSQAYAVEGRAADEYEANSRAYAVDPLAPLVLLNYAIVSRHRGHRRQADRLVEELAALQPDSSALYRVRSDLALEDGRLDESVRWLAAATRHDPDDAGTHGGLALRYRWLGDFEHSLSHIVRLNEITPGGAWGAAANAFLHLEAGEVEAAGGPIHATAGRHDADPDFQRAKAVYLMKRGDNAAALEAILAATPRLREPSPPIGFGPVFWDAPMAVFLLRETGDEERARRLAEAFARGADSYYKPVEGQEMGNSLWVRAEMAAVTGDRAELIDNLTRFYDQGGILPAFIPKQPWYEAYRNDADLTGLFAKFDARRAEARKSLRAQGL